MMNARSKGHTVVWFTGPRVNIGIAAEHCGYRPLVVGAGDDRTPEALKDVFSRAMLGNTLSRDNSPLHHSR